MPFEESAPALVVLEHAELGVSVTPDVLTGRLADSANDKLILPLQ